MTPTYALMAIRNGEARAVIGANDVILADTMLEWALDPDISAIYPY